MEALPSDLRSGGSGGLDQASELELKLDLELPDSKPNKCGRTFPYSSLNSVGSKRRGKTFLISFIIVPMYSTEPSRE